MFGQPQVLRRWNEQAVFRRLLGGGPATRAQLAAASGLSAPTVGKVAEALLAAGLIEEDAETAVASTAGAMGRPGRTLRVNQSARRIVAIQLGVRHTRVAALPLVARTRDHWEHQFDTPATARTWIRRLAGALHDMQTASPWAVMVSVPGVVDEAAGRVLLSPNLHWSCDADLAACVAEAAPQWQAPVALVQEIRSLALGERAVSPQHEDFLLVDIGEGVGAAVVLDGRLFHGALPISGELGHSPVAGGDRSCGCGGSGCLETLLSRGGLLRSFAETVRRRHPTWPQLQHHVARRGIDPWLAQTLDHAASVIVSAVNVLGVSLVLVTGALGELPPCVMTHLGEQVQRRAMWSRFGQVRCTSAERRRAAGLIAAAIERVVMPLPGSGINQESLP